MTRTTTLSGNQDSVTISFDFYELGSWDGLQGTIGPDELFISINGTQVIQDHFYTDSIVYSAGDDNAPKEHAISTVSGVDFDQAVPADGSDEIWRYEFTVETSAASILFGIDSVTNNLQDEFFGIDNFSIDENSDVLIGTTGDDTLRDEEGARDVILGDGGNDTIILEANLFGATQATFTNIDGGLGDDTLALVDGLDLDLTNINNLALASVEVIDMADGEANTLTLGLDDVLDASEDISTLLAANVPTATDGLLIDGEAGDVVNLQDAPGGHPNAPGPSDGWQMGVNFTDGGQTYTPYNYVSGGDIIASVAVDADITTNT